MGVTTFILKHFFFAKVTLIMKRMEYFGKWAIHGVTFVIFSKGDLNRYTLKP